MSHLLIEVYSGMGWHRLDSGLTGSNWLFFFYSTVGESHYFFLSISYSVLWSKNHQVLVLNMVKYDY